MDGAAVGERLIPAPALEAIATLNRRRRFVLLANAVTWLGLMAWAASIATAGGITALDAVLLTSFALATPWSVLGFWNSLIGVWQLHRPRASLHDVAPFLSGSDAATPVRVNTAVLMTLRNEDPGRALARFMTIKASLDATGYGERFSYFVLSDSDQPNIAQAEERAIAAWREGEPGSERIIYRRRIDNSGYKAGNVRDFCQRWGGSFELMLPLDADSLMTGEAVVKLVRIMESHPRIGILQSLVVGTPANSAFTRLFQFGMRLGMRAYTMGQAWWVGDCGPYWGHNALIRIKPFQDHCELPILPGRPPLGGAVLSHDQVEAVLMRKAGYEVRVMPVEGGSFEDNPPDALAFIRRDVRWCQGNMQYLKLLTLRGIEPVSRFQLIWAIVMFIGIPAWTLMIALLPLASLDATQIAGFPYQSAKALYVAVLLMYLAPKIAGFIDALLTKGEVARFGGALRFTVSALLELVFSFLQGAVSTIRTTLFMLGLPFGKSIAWSGQRRDTNGVSWRDAFAALWPQLVFGSLVLWALAVISPAVLIWSLPLTAGYLLAIPFTVLTANSKVGHFFKRHGIAGVPEDFSPPAEIRAIQASTTR